MAGALGYILGTIVGAAVVGGLMLLATVVVVGAAARSWWHLFFAAAIWALVVRLLYDPSAPVLLWPDFIAAFLGMAATRLAAGALPRRASPARVTR